MNGLSHCRRGDPRNRPGSRRSRSPTGPPSTTLPDGEVTVRYRGPDHGVATQHLLVGRLFADCRFEGRLDPLAADLLLELFLDGFERTDAGRTGGQKQSIGAPD